MAVLVTRPQPDNEVTAATLRARGFEVLLAPMLRFAELTVQDEVDAGSGGTAISCATAVRCRRAHRQCCQARALRHGHLGQWRRDRVARSGAGPGQGERAEEDEYVALFGRRRSGAGPW